MGEVSDPEQQYSLRWNDFHASILSSFRHLRDEEDFVDVTLACDGCSFTAHKVVLSACSPYFRRLLKANPCQHPIVILRDVKEKDMESLLRFMYNGEVHIGQEQLSDFLKTAQMLQVRGLADVPTKESQKLPTTSEHEAREHSNDDGMTPPPKRSRTERDREHPRDFSPSPASSNHNVSADQLMRDTLLSQALEGGPAIHSTNAHQKNNSDSSLQAQSTGEDSNSSDTGLSERGGPISDLVHPKAEPNDYGSLDDSHHHIGNGNHGMDPHRTPTFPAALLGLQGIPGLLPGPSGLHNSSQDVNFVSRRGLDMMRVRATDPRPCPKCGKIYRSAHTLRTHLEDKHTVCPGYRCVLCGTVAKSRNSLHSHMSRQHRGISTKDLPVLPMPSPFDPELASRLLAKAGVKNKRQEMLNQYKVAESEDYYLDGEENEQFMINKIYLKVSAAELRARASPTGPRRPELRLEIRGNHVDSMPPRYSAPSEGGSSVYGGDDPEDLTVTNSRFEPLSPPPQSTAVITKVGPIPAKHHHSSSGPIRAPPPPPLPAAALTGSAILDTYLQFIAENSNNLALGLSPEQIAAAKAASLNHLDKQREGDLNDRREEDREDLESSGVEDDDYSEDEREAIKAE